MQGEYHLAVHGELTHPVGQHVGRVDVLRTMQRHQQVPRVCTRHGGELVLGALRCPQVRVDHDVTHELPAVRQPLAFEVLHRDGRWGEQEVGEMIRHDPVPLLGHERVERPQARLDVCQPRHAAVHQ